MTDLVRVVDKEGVVVYVSPSHEHVLGISPKVIEGYSVFKLVHPEDIHGLQSQFEYGVSEKEDHTAEFRIKHAKGHWVWIEAHAKLILDEQDQVQSLQLVGRDITERKMRVQKCIRKRDILARHGGDEFTILLAEIDGEKEAIMIAERILAVLQEPWVIHQHEFQTTSSIGVVFYPKDGTSFGELMKHADTAMYAAKQAGRNGIKVYTH